MAQFHPARSVAARNSFPNPIEPRLGKIVEPAWNKNSESLLSPVKLMQLKKWRVPSKGSRPSRESPGAKDPGFGRPSFLRQSVYRNPHEEAGPKQILEDCSEEPLFV